MQLKKLAYLEGVLLASQKHIAVAANDVSSELENVRLKAKTLNKDVKDKKNCEMVSNLSLMQLIQITHCSIRISWAKNASSKFPRAYVCNSSECSLQHLRAYNLDRLISLDYITAMRGERTHNGIARV